MLTTTALDQMDQKGQTENNTDNSLSTPSEERKTREPLGEKWYATINNWTAEKLDQMDQILKTHPKILKAVVGQEVGECGTPHLQCYIVFDRRIRPRASGIFEELGTCIHWGDAKGKPCKKKMPDAVGINYCSKDGKFVCYRCTVPKAVSLVTYDLLRPEQKTIADRYKTPENPLFGREIHWYWEAKGGWGKSVLCKYMVDQMNALVVSGKTADIFCGIQKRIEDGQDIPIVILDVPRTSMDYINYQAIEKVKDGCFFSGKYESGMVRFDSPHLVVFANQAPNMDQMSKDRWVIQKL